MSEEQWVRRKIERTREAMRRIVKRNGLAREYRAMERALVQYTEQLLVLVAQGGAGDQT